MLNHIKSYYFVPTHNHLGDIVNILQQIHQRSLERPNLYLVSGKICSCCSINSEKMIKDILSLLDTSVKYGKSKECIDVSPCWTKIHKSTIYDWKYSKSKKLPKQGNHIVCQFDQRSKGNKVPDNFIDLIKSDMINIGDRELPCINKMNLDLLEKFDILASAKGFLSIDSGLAGLALLSNVPIIIVHPKSWNAPKYYPKSDQIRFMVI